MLKKSPPPDPNEVLLEANLLKTLLPGVKQKDIIFLCIGTDRSTGDSLGPIVGTRLTELGYSNVYGTIRNPVHAVNLKQTIESLPKDKKVIAIDACLGNISNIGRVRIAPEPLLPRAIEDDHDLPMVGDVSIKGVVNICTPEKEMRYLILGNTRLFTVVSLANKIISQITNAFPPPLLLRRKLLSI